jgi:hypothetical protein
MPLAQCILGLVCCASCINAETVNANKLLTQTTTCTTFIHLCIAIEDKGEKYNVGTMP